MAIDNKLVRGRRAWEEYQGDINFVMCWYGFDLERAIKELVHAGELGSNVAEDILYYENNKTQEDKDNEMKEVLRMIEGE